VVCGSTRCSQHCKHVRGDDAWRRCKWWWWSAHWSGAHHLCEQRSSHPQASDPHGISNPTQATAQPSLTSIERSHTVFTIGYIPVFVTLWLHNQSSEPAHQKSCTMHASPLQRCHIRAIHALSETRTIAWHHLTFGTMATRSCTHACHPNIMPLHHAGTVLSSCLAPRQAEDVTHRMIIVGRCEQHSLRACALWHAIERTSLLAAQLACHGPWAMAAQLACHGPWVWCDPSAACGCG
jgi:hypothetical protein